MPSEDELASQFESFMEEKCMKPDARTGMRKLPSTTKWMMLCADSAIKGHSSPHEDTPTHYVHLLRDGKLSKKDMESLKISLRGAGKTWMTSFAEEGGVSLMLEALGKQRKAVGVVGELLGGLKTFMNNEYGLSVVVSTPQGIDCLVSALGSAGDGERSQIVDLLAVICWISDRGHDLIVHSFSSRQSTYDVLVQALHSPNLDTQTRVLTFINALINAVTCLDDRTRMRRKLIDLGLRDSLTKVADVVDAHRGDQWDGVEKLSVQLELYHQVAAADARETTLLSLDFADVDAAFEYVKRTSAEEGHSSHLIDLLHQLAVLGGEGEGSAVWDNILYAVDVISGRVVEGGEALPLTYAQLKLLLADKEKADTVHKAEHLKQLEAQVEAQRQQLHEWTMKAEHERDEWRSREEELKATIRELRTKAEADDLDKVKRLHAEVDDLKRQLQQAKDAAASAPAAAAGAPPAPAFGAPDAPPMAPPMAPGMGDVPVPPPFGAPDAPPMAPPMAPPLAPPMSGDVPMAPDAPPMAPPMAPGMAPDAPPMAPGMAPDAPPMAPGMGPPPSPRSPRSSRRSPPRPRRALLHRSPCCAQEEEP